MLRILVASLLCIACAPSFCTAVLVVNDPVPITRKLTVNPIVVYDDTGSQAANYLGNPSQEAGIKGMVDTIWAQAGIDIAWLPTVVLNSTETLNGSQPPHGNDPRPDTDLSGDPAGSDHESIGRNAGVKLDNTVNMFFVDIAAGFPALSGNTVAGLAETPGDDVSMYVGANLFDFSLGGEAIASLIAHEIGHNLSLAHDDLPENLMQPSESMMADGERLTAAQIHQAHTSGMSTGLLTAVPEPNAFSLVGFVLACLGTAKFCRK